MNRVRMQSVSARAVRAGSLIGVVVMALGGCGGSSSDDGDDSQYITWQGSANGVLIRDANNDGFAVRASDREVVWLDTRTALVGLTVDTGANVRYDNVVIGAVVRGVGTNGQSITVLQCSSGTGMDISFNGNAWSYRCI